MTFRPGAAAACAAALLFLFAGLIVTPRPARAAESYSRLYVFGDSLSDSGNFFAATGQPGPPYVGGRFSNGPVWAEYFASLLGVPATNFAFGGARTDASNQFNPPAPVPGMRTQVNNYLASTPAADPRALYVLWGGANDYLNGGQTNPAVPVNNLIGEVSDLAARGARNFLVVNVPDLGTLPGTSGRPVAAPLSLLTAAHNAGLASALNGLRPRLPGGANLFLFDVNALFREARTDPAVFGFSNVTTAYLAGGSGDPNRYLFWDDVHPTTAAHQLIAARALGVVSVVPEPGTLALCATAGLMLAQTAVRKRRRGSSGRAA